jgi:DNA replication licensing factor MCM6
MARTSILAASNPVFGRYDKTKPLRYNIDISAPIMSRFDLFFIIVDECNEYTDYAIAQHIINLHKNDDKGKSNAPFTQEQLMLYIRFAKNMKPKLTKEAMIRLRDEYRHLRQSDISSQKTAYRITVRQLESLIRLSEALAKLHLDEYIHPVYVEEASRLLKQSIIRVDMPDVEFDFDNKLTEQRNAFNQGRLSITGTEYEMFKTAIVHFIKELENQSKLILI